MKKNTPGKVYFAPWERALDRILTPFEEFIHRETTGGQLLLCAVVIALILANGPWAEQYQSLLHVPLGISIGAWKLEHSLQHWINDGLMALFFFVVGLEIKREVLIGELSNLRVALLPILAAMGGMIVPAVLFAMLNHDGEGARGWGIPMATDIAFAVGVLVLLGARIPKNLIVFLVALAIVDDLGAVLVIALFYTTELNLRALAAAVFLLGVLIAMNLAGVRRPLPHALVAVGLWLATLESGVHATVAGVLAAWTVPSTPKYDPERFTARTRALIERFAQVSAGTTAQLHNESQRALLTSLKQAVRNFESPLQRLEHAMHLPAAFFIVPIFAFANAGIPLDFGAIQQALQHPVTLGILLGLPIGKLIGITGVSLLAVRLGLCELPAGCNKQHLIGVGFLGGIGFTMSIFIAELGFANDGHLLLLAKMGVLLASLLAAIAGLLCLYFSPRGDTRQADE